MPPIGSYKSKPRFSIVQERVNPNDPTSPLAWFIYQGNVRLAEEYPSREEAEKALASLKRKYGLTP